MSLYQAEMCKSIHRPSSIANTNKNSHQRQIFMANTTNRVATGLLRPLTIFLLWGSCVSQLLPPQADPTRFPYYTLLYGRGSKCRASLVAPDIVLASAHCIRSEIGNRTFQIWVNCTYYEFYSEDRKRTGYKRSPVDVVVHPGFDDVLMVNDIAVIQLNASVAGVPTVRINRNASIPLPTRSLTAIGFYIEFTVDTVIPRKTLSMISMNLSSIQVCKDHPCYSSRVFTPGKTMCAGRASQACGGFKSGVPLLIKGTSARDDVLVGMSAFDGDACTFQCVVQGTPGAFTRLSYYAKWIDQQVCRLSSAKPTTCPGNQEPSTKPPTRKQPTKPPTRKP